MKKSVVTLALIGFLQFSLTTLAVDGEQMPSDVKENSTKIRTNITVNKLKGYTPKPIPANNTRVKNLDSLLKNFQASLKQSFENKIVPVYKRFGSRLVLLETLKITYQSNNVNSENWGFTVESENIPVQFDSSFNGLAQFLSNRATFDSFFNIYDVKFNKEKEPHLANISKKYLIIPKIPLKNIKQIIVFINNQGQLSMFEVLNSLKGSLVYDLEGNVKNAPKLN